MGDNKNVKENICFSIAILQSSSKLIRDNLYYVLRSECGRFDKMKQNSFHYSFCHISEITNTRHSSIDKDLTELLLVLAVVRLPCAAR